MKLPATRSLYAYWDRLRGGRAAPERSELDPGAIRTLLGDVFLLEFVGAGQYVVRLAGTRICALLGHEWKSRPFAEPFAAEDWPELQALLDGVSNAVMPVVASITAETRDGRGLDLEMLVLPLRHRGRTNARILGSLATGKWSHWAGQVPLTRFRLNSIRHLRPDGAAGDELDLVTPPPRMPLGRLRLLPGGRA
jgi:hypothetical protein